VDVDFPEPKTGGGLLSALFGRKKKEPELEPVETRVTAQAGTWLQAEPQWGWRVYRTRGGARLLATHQPMNPGDPLVEKAFDAFNADPLYRGLCARQECFRARLTPKHWRCNVARRPPCRWPWASDETEHKFHEWEERYLNAAKDYATCKLIGHFGIPEIHPALRELVEFHDKATRVDSEMPLA
jgi:hypothetical protein